MDEAIRLVGSIPELVLIGLEVLPALLEGGRQSWALPREELGRQRDGLGVELASLLRGGRRAEAGWYYNVMSESRVEVLVAGQRRRCTARLLEGAERERVWDHFVRFNPHFNRYQARVSREIPLIALDERPNDVG